MTRLRLWSFPGDKVRGARQSLLPEDDAVGCGIRYIGLFEASSPMVPACLAHDTAYDAHELGVEPRSRREVDQAFLNDMKTIAGNSLRLKLLAYTYYGIARVFGGLFW